MSLREAAEKALHCLETSRVFVTSRERIKRPEGEDFYDEAINALRAALAESAGAEPVAWCKPCHPDHAEDKRVYLAQDYDFSGGYGVRKEAALSHGWIPLYTHPPAREAELRDEEIQRIWDDTDEAPTFSKTLVAFARRVRAAMGKG